ncbi:nineteen complex-related protein 2-domain-containing protein [Irpex rosettiformis]|uniref:Nineteen complex-related protein 2-domain-containing protein n=1 Tax=Irpex rosettiformis TaxID=378272 RepID=A0ACB8TYH1_9APHY|nr:nineteen complex-related protein 2-domain-containing protein [Irpex rosettiformis]
MVEDEPVLFKRKGARPSQRSRPAETDVETATEVVSDTAGTGDESPSILAAKLKNKLKTRTKPKSKLSFGGADEDEGDGEVFKVKKSNLSRKLALGKSSLVGNVSPSSHNPTSSRPEDRPTYDAAYLSELKAATPSSRPKMNKDESISYDNDISLNVDSPGNVSHLQEVVDLTGDVDMEASIPSSSAINAAKEKRERLRQTEPFEQDFISLSLTKRQDISQGPHPESRLVREDDEVGEGDDEYAEYTSAQERIALGKKSRKVEARKRREEMNEMIVDAEEQDEETMEWEQEQLRRGGLKTGESDVKPQKQTYKPSPIPPMTPIPQLAPAIARLTAALTALTTSHAQNTLAMHSLADEKAQLEVREKEMREMVVKAEDKRSWFAAFRDWIESVATFLDEKYPQLEKLEDDHVSLLQERSDMISKRRTTDDEDDLALVFGNLPTQATQQAEQTDELGRVISAANTIVGRRDRITARAQRRLLRRAKKNIKTAEEGYSTDSSLPPSDAEDFDTAIEKLLEKRREVLADVRAKDFKDPGIGLSKWFSEWRERFGDSYTGAWGGLGMVGAWEFWTRLEIVGWNPLEDIRNLDTFIWYKSLYEYSRPDEGEDELGPDGDLVSAMISTAIVPRFCKIIEAGAFNPYSTHNVRIMIDLAEQIEASVERDDLKFQTLLKSVFVVFQRTVASVETAVTPYLSTNNPRFDPEAIPARRRYLNRCSKLLLSMTRWRKFTGERFGIGMLMTNLSTNCMLPVAESGWEVGGEEIIRKVASTLPKELLSGAIQARLSS